MGHWRIFLQKERDRIYVETFLLEKMVIFMRTHKLLILFIVFWLIALVSLSGCISNEKKITPQKENMSASNKYDNSTEKNINVRNPENNNIVINENSTLNTVRNPENSTLNTVETSGDKDKNSKIETPAKIAAPTRVRNLSTGTILRRTLGSDGNGDLTIKNGLNFDAIAVLTRSDFPNEAVLSVYIGTNSSYTISYIPGDAYYLFYKTGKDWDDSIRKFTIPGESKRFENKLIYGSPLDYDEQSYIATLEQVDDGNAPTTSVRESDFPK